MSLRAASHKRTGLTETVLVISIFVCTNSTLYYSFCRNSAGIQESVGLSRISCIKWPKL